MPIIIEETGFDDAKWLVEKDSLVEHIVHIDGVTGSSPVATTREPNRKVRLVLYKEEE